MENLSELISKANEIQSLDERICFIMNYFLQNVKYNYAYLFTKGYLQGTISSVSNDFVLEENKTRTDEDEEFSFTRSILQGESRIFNDILQLRDTYSGNYTKFIEELQKYIIKELSNHIGNEDIVYQNAKTIIARIEQGLREKITITFEGNEYSTNYDISKVLIDFLLYGSKYFPPEFNNGLITKGVCKDFSKYIVPILEEVGIEAHNIEGTSELGHSWIIVKVNDKYKSIDLTRAIFIRDGFLGIPSEQTCDDWLYCDIKKIFEMQSTRTINKIDNITLPNTITPENYNDLEFMDLMQQINNQAVEDNTFKQILEHSLKSGITKGDCSRANHFEQDNNNKEESKNEH